MDPVTQYVQNHQIWGPALCRASEKAGLAGTEGKLPSKENFLRLIEKAREIYEYRWRAYIGRHHGAEKPVAAVGYYLERAVCSLFGETDPEYPGGGVLFPPVADAWEQVNRRLGWEPGEADANVRPSLEKIADQLAAGEIDLSFEPYVWAHEIEPFLQMFKDEIKPALEYAGLFSQYFWWNSGGGCWMVNHRVYQKEISITLHSRKVPAFFSWLLAEPQIAKAVNDWRQYGQRGQEIARQIRERRSFEFELGDQKFYLRAPEPSGKEGPMKFFRICPAIPNGFDWSVENTLHLEVALPILEAWAASLGIPV